MCASIITTTQKVNFRVAQSLLFTFASARVYDFKVRNSTLEAKNEAMSEMHGCLLG